MVIDVKKSYYIAFCIPVFLTFLFISMMIIKNKEQSTDVNNNSQVEYLQKQIETIYSMLDEEKIDFDKINYRFEIMYQNTPNIMLELYEKGINQEKILGFNDTIDNVFHDINNKNDSEVFEDLGKLYEYLSSFVVDDELYTSILEVKSNIYKCRSKLNRNDWDSLNEYNNIAVQKYNNILNSLDKRLNQKQVNVAYISINEMENAIKLRDKAIYLIKYRFLLEELNSI